MFNRTSKGAVLTSLLSILLIAACAAPSPPEILAFDKTAAIQGDPFPVPAGLRPQIEFWQKVYSLWRQRQVVLHDDRYMDVVYAVLELPGEVDMNSGYTMAQRSFVKTRQQALVSDLERLESKLRTGSDLTTAEQALAALITAKVSRQAIVGASSRVRSQRGLQERFKRGLELSGRYVPLFETIFQDMGLPPDLAYLPHVESSFQGHARSSAGAVGMWQFTRGAASIYMRTHPALDERYDPVASARGAARYLFDAHNRLGDWALAITSYNHGINGMSNAKNLFGNDFMAIVNYYEHRAFGFASRNFYAEFLAARAIAGDPERFFPGDIYYQTPLDWDRIVLQQPTLASELALFYDIELGSLAAMNRAWTQAALRDRVALPAGTEIWLPAGTLAHADRAAGVERAALARHSSLDVLTGLTE